MIWTGTIQVGVAEARERIEVVAKRRWSGLSTAQRQGIVLSGTVQSVLLAAALMDNYRRPGEEIRGNKVLWVLVSFVNFIGPISYFLFGRKR